MIEQLGTYNSKTRNCQDFADSLAELIIDRTVVEPDSRACYRFREETLKFMTGIECVGPKPGYILPTETDILINVTETEDAEIWRGQVKDTQKCGKFLRTYYDVHCSSTPLTSITVTGRQYCGT